MTHTKRKALAIAVAGGALLALGAALWWTGYQRGWVRLNYPSAESYPVRGIDVSHHQGRIDWSRVREADVAFAFIKATEGMDHLDRQFEANWAHAADAGIRRGAYHFFTFCTPGTRQADHFIGTVGDSFGELPPVVDVEFSGNCHGWESIASIRRELGIFLRRVEAASGTRPILYFTEDAYDRILRGHFDPYPLWARNVLWEPAPHGERPWSFWQYADNGRVGGIHTLVDLNVFHGSDAEFAAYTDRGRTR